MALVSLGTSPRSFDLRKESSVDTVRIGNKREFGKEEGIAGADEGLGSRERERERVTQVNMHISLGIGRNKTKVRHVERRRKLFANIIRFRLSPSYLPTYRTLVKTLFSKS